MATTPSKSLKTIKPLVSSNRTEAKRAVLNLFKAWCRTIPYMNSEYAVPLSYDETVQRIRNEFLKHKDVTDIRIIDMLILQSRHELQEIKSRHKNLCQFYYRYKETPPSPPKTFMEKFLSGSD